MADKEFFKEVLDTFENDDLKEFCDQCLDTIPDYFWKVGASSTGKYHPEYALGDHGLARHTLALCRIMNHLFSIDCVKNQYTSRERDLLRISGLMHDTRKSGSQEDYEKSKYTKFDHPLLASNEIARVWNNYDGIWGSGIQINAILVLCCQFHKINIKSYFMYATILHLVRI